MVFRRIFRQKYTISVSGDCFWISWASKVKSSGMVLDWREKKTILFFSGSGRRKR